MRRFCIPCAGSHKRAPLSCSLSTTAAHICLKMKEEEQIKINNFSLSDIFPLWEKRHYFSSALTMS